MKKSLKRNLSVIILSALITASTVISTVCNAEGTNDSPKNEKVGMAHLDYSTTNETVSLEGCEIYDDDTYSITWDFSDPTAFNEASDVQFYVENAYPYPLGIIGELDLSIDEIWIDDVKLDEELSGKYNFGTQTDSIYYQNEATMIKIGLRNSSYNDIDIPVKESIKVVFTLSNLTDTSEFSMDGRPTSPLPPSQTTTTTTTAPALETTTTTSEITTTTTASSTTNASTVTTTSNTVKNNAPKTGDAGVAGFLGLLTLGGFTAYMSKGCKRK